jgi:hypothetical protein
VSAVDSLGAYKRSFTDARSYLLTDRAPFTAAEAAARAAFTSSADTS